jgi:hypothetical protein
LNTARIDDNRMLESILYCRCRGQRNLVYGRKRFIGDASGKRQMLRYSMKFRRGRRKEDR